MLHGIGGGVGHGRLQNKQEISHLRVAAVIDAAVTLCIGAGFLVCLGLVFSML